MFFTWYHFNLNNTSVKLWNFDEVINHLFLFLLCAKAYVCLVYIVYLLKDF